MSRMLLGPSSPVLDHQVFSLTGPVAPGASLDPGLVPHAVLDHGHQGEYPPLTLWSTIIILDCSVMYKL